jgi:hypothetical protein
MNLNLENVNRREVEPEPITVKRSQGWEVLGFFVMLAAFTVVIVFGNWQWATLLMLFAIYCAAMR